MSKNYVSLQEFEDEWEQQQQDQELTRELWIQKNYDGIMNDFEEINNPSLDFDSFAKEYYNDIFGGVYDLRGY